MRRNEKFVLLAVGCLSVLLTASCGKDTPSVIDDEIPPVFGEPAVKSKGQPIGDAVSAMIGPNGGVLWYEDALRIEVPAGAVDQPTTFGIQPISNTHDEAVTTQAFRLTPEGTHFKKPVKISFIYEPTAKGTPRARMVAFQRHDGVWCGVSTVLDESQRQLTVETTHFSDWVWFDMMSLRKDKESVGAGEEVKLKLLEQILGELIPANHIDSVSLAAMEDIGYWKNDVTVTGWKIVSGPGSLEPKINTNMLLGDAIYRAPATINEITDVEIQVEVESRNGYISDRTAPNGRRKLGKLILLTKIRLVPDNYFYLQMDGVRYDLSAGAAGSVIGGQITIGGANDGGVQITLACYGARSGNYPGGVTAGKSFAMSSFPTAGEFRRTYQNVYLVCDGEHQYSGVTAIKSANGVIEGTFSGRLYYSNQACGYRDAKDITCTFKIKQG